MEFLISAILVLLALLSALILWLFVQKDSVWLSVKLFISTITIAFIALIYTGSNDIAGFANKIIDGRVRIVAYYLDTTIVDGLTEKTLFLTGYKEGVNNNMFARFLPLHEPRFFKFKITPELEKQLEQALRDAAGGADMYLEFGDKRQRGKSGSGEDGLAGTPGEADRDSGQGAGYDKPDEYQNEIPRLFAVDPRQRLRKDQRESR